MTFVCGVYNNCLGEWLLAEDKSKLNFEAALAKAEAFERSQDERRKVHLAPNVLVVTSQSSKQGKPFNGKEINCKVLSLWFFIASR